MYRCQVCGRVAGPHVPSVRLVVETRAAVHRFRKNVHKVVKIGPDGRRKKVKKKDWLDDPGGKGREIAKEVTACPDCASNRR